MHPLYYIPVLPIANNVGIAHFEAGIIAMLLICQFKVGS
jgi:hypothetical protein